MALQALIFVKNTYLAFMDLGKRSVLEDLNFLSPSRSGVKLSLSVAQLISKISQSTSWMDIPHVVLFVLLKKLRVIFFLFFFFFVQRWHRTDKDLYIWTAHVSTTIRHYYTRSRKSKWLKVFAKCQVRWAIITAISTFSDWIRVYA